MSDDLIRRSDAIKAMEQRYQDILRIFKRKVKDGEKAIALDMIGCIKSLPSADRLQKVIAQITFDEEKLREIVKEAVERFKEEYEIADRPQGEWIRTGRTNIYGGIEVQCSNCGDRVMVQHLEDEWYCRHCGADMGMKGADDE